MEPRPELVVQGVAGARRWTFDHATLAALDAAHQVRDVGVLVPGKKGRGVRVAALLAREAIGADARFVDVASSDPGFAVSLPLEEVRDRGIVVYELDGAPLPAAKGGPFRLLVVDHDDECVHVKHLASLTLSAARGRDTRPVDDAAHAALHAAKCKPTPRSPA